ncbi:hypothetical protein ACFFRL_19660 [Agromyces hippuratus]|uniref:hypothetical protein n=1 Tax=Agromyces hippuratus TaxID=286438 RepID=UPI0035EB8B22
MRMPPPVSSRGSRLDLHTSVKVRHCRHGITDHRPFHPAITRRAGPARRPRTRLPLNGLLALAAVVFTGSSPRSSRPGSCRR